MGLPESGGGPAPWLVPYAYGVWIIGYAVHGLNAWVGIYCLSVITNIVASMSVIIAPAETETEQYFMAQQWGAYRWPKT